MSAPLRLMIWVQNLLGSGHLSRCLRIAKAAVDQGCHCMIVNGGFDAKLRAGDRIEWQQLPPLRAASLAFTSLVDDDGREADAAYWAKRQKHLRAASDAFQPDVILTEMFPFGRRKFSGELLPWFEHLPASTRIACSVRDILVSAKKPKRVSETADLIEKHYDMVLVHSDPKIQSFDPSFAEMDRIRGKVHYTGYVAAPPNRPRNHERSGIIVSVGSGIVGQKLITAVLEHQNEPPYQDQPVTIVCGGNVSADDLQNWHDKAGDHVAVFGFRPDLAERIAQAKLSISQAGYNTVAETLAAGTPMLLVPFATETEDEQSRRARGIEALGRAVVVPEDQLNEDEFLKAAVKAMKLPTRPLDIDIGGAGQSIEWLKQLVQSSQ